MVSGSCKEKLILYYGFDRLEELLRYEKVVLQPDHYMEEELRFLKNGGVSPLAYLSVGEDPGSDAPWHIPGKRSEWGGFWVDPYHPEWVARLLEKTRFALAKGFLGLFLDTLDTAAEVSREGALYLVKRMRNEAKKAYILANRGFALLPELAQYVNGILFESFSTTHSPRYARLSEDRLRQNEIIAYYLKTFGKELFALDYADSEELRAFACQRARNLGLYPVVSDKYLTFLP